MNITIVIKNVTSEIHGLDNNIQLIQILSNSVSYTVPNYFFSPKYKSGVWDGTIQLSKFHKGVLYFPTGLFSRIYNTLQQLTSSISSIQIIDQRVKPTQQTPIPLNPKYKLWEGIQDTALQQAITCERGIIRVPTGGGKTVLCAAIAAHWNLPTLITTHQIEIANHLISDIENATGIKVGVIQGPQKVLHQINVATIQTLTRCLTDNSTDLTRSNIAEWLQTTCNVWLADEAHRTPSKTFTLLSNRLYNAYYRIGLTATPYRADNADIAIEAGLGRKIFDISTSELIKQGRLAKPYIFFLNYKSDKKQLDNCPKCNNAEIKQIEKLYVRCKNKIGIKKCGSKYHVITDLTTAVCPNCSSAIWIEQILAEGLTKKFKFGGCCKCGNEWPLGYGYRIKGIVQNDERNDLILAYASRFIKKNKSVLISVQYKKHCQDLYEKLSQTFGDKVVLVTGDIKDRQQFLDKLETKEILCIVATAVFDEGINIPSLDVLIMGKAGSTKGNLMQIVGRVLRRTAKKRKVIVLDFNDKFKTYGAKSKARKDLLVEEPEFVIKELPVGSIIKA